VIIRIVFLMRVKSNGSVKLIVCLSQDCLVGIETRLQVWTVEQ
jgi:hypothetical protein